MNMVQKVAARFLEAQSQRSKARDLTTPVNKPRDIDRDIQKTNGVPDTSRPDAVKPAKNDVRPQDVFNATPDNTGVLSLAQTGKDLSHAIDTKIPKDKGYDNVSNLSQYLIESQGGGSGKPVK